MTPEQISLIEATMTAPGFVLDRIVRDFYRRLFAAHPEVVPMFSRDQHEQEVRFAAELDAILHVVRRHDEFMARVAALGERHRAYGVRAAHYRSARVALLGALQTNLGSDWTPEAEEAWRLAYELAAEVMMAGTADTPADPSGVDA
jgi:hemoglobin-like flavoprotein